MQFFKQTLMSPMADPTPVKNAKTQEMMKAQIHTLTEAISDASNEYTELSNVWTEE